MHLTKLTLLLKGILIKGTVYAEVLGRCDLRMKKSKLMSGLLNN